MKVSTSCTQCRASKRRCTIAGSAGIGDTCQQCSKQGKRCSLSKKPKKAQNYLLPAPALASHGGSGHGLSSEVVSPKIRDQLVDLYLRFIHDKPHTLFHPSLLKQRVRDGSLPLAVLYGIMALAARFADDEETRLQTRSLLLAAKNALKLNIDDVSIDNMHASILVGNLCGTEGEPAGEAVFFGVAFRMAHILRLSESSMADDSITKEIKIRTWWSLYMIDQWSSAGLNLPRQMHSHHNHLPMAETEFWELSPGERMDDTSQRRQGLWAYMVTLARIFGHIQILHQRLAEGILDENDAELTTAELAQQFDSFLQDLPASLRFTTRNLTRHVELGLGQAFVALHLGYHHYSTLLYFPYLDMRLVETPSRADFISRCKYHATSFSDLLKVSYETPNCEAVYFIVAHMTVVSSSVLLHTLLFGSENELIDARTRLYFNFEILLKLKGYWQGVELMMERLFTFQEVCMRSMDRTYTVDRWTVKFLLQHAIPINGQIDTPATSELAERGKFASDALLMLRPAA